MCISCKTVFAKMYADALYGWYGCYVLAMCVNLIRVIDYLIWMVACVYEMFTNPFVFKLFPYLWVHLVIDLLEVTQAGLPTRGGGRVQAAKKDLPRGRRQEGHLKVLGYGEVLRHLAGREHILQEQGRGL